MRKSYLAFRIPFSKKINYFEGFANAYQLFDEIKNQKGFVFHSFEGKENYFLKDLTRISPNQIKIFNGDDIIQATNFEEYSELFTKLQKGIEKELFIKAIASRIIEKDLKIEPLEVFNRLNTHYQNTFNYLISIEGVGTWMGCTPEKFLQVKKGQLKTVSLAGTKFKKGKAWGEKEKEEQKIVSQFIHEALEKNKCKNIIEKGPYTSKSAQLFHLKTNFTCSVSNQNLTNLINDLHPTPATCGLPKKNAQKFIIENEKHARKFYTGYLGTISPNEMNLFVNLRCMEIIQQKAILYVGGGITKDSILKNEWLETEKKAETLLSRIEG